jgi:hypothetical protein
MQHDNSAFGTSATWRDMATKAALSSEADKRSNELTGTGRRLKGMMFP